MQTIAMHGIGKMINHSKKMSNIIPCLKDIGGKPHIIFFTKRGINAKEEILYDYGDNSAASIEAHPWLKQ